MSRIGVAWEPALLLGESRKVTREQHAKGDTSTRGGPRAHAVSHGSQATAGMISRLKGLVHDNAHARRLSLQNKFVGSTLNSKSPLPVQSLKILRFIRTSVALAGLVILR